jgi:hypothetical protein
MLVVVTVEGRMTIDRRLLNWGVFLVLVGGVPLAVTQGWIPRDVVARAWELWPLVLIGAGIGLILATTPLRAIGGLVVAGTLGVMLGAFIAVGFGGFSIGTVGCGGAEDDAPRVVSETGSFEGGTGRVVLDATCTSIVVSTTAGASWAVDVRGTEDPRPTVERSADRVAVRSPGTPVALPFTARQSTWRVALGTEPRLGLEVTLNAGSAEIDLDGANLDRLSVDGNAIGDSRIDLSGATIARLDVGINAADGTVEGNAASVRLCAPAGVGLRLLVDGNVAASHNYDDQGLVERGNAWETPDFAGATTRIVLRTSGNAISYTLNPEDGCR